MSTEKLLTLAGLVLAGIALFMVLPSHRARAVIRIVTFLDDEFVSGRVENDFHFFRAQTLFHFLDLKIDNVQEVRLFKRVKHSDLIETI